MVPQGSKVPEVKYLLNKAALLFPQFLKVLPRFTNWPLLLVLQDLVNDGSACVLFGDFVKLHLLLLQTSQN